jgi:hypothetical protein
MLCFPNLIKNPTSTKILSYSGKLRGAGPFPGCMSTPQFPVENPTCIFVRIHISAFVIFKANKGHRQPVLHFLLQHGLDLHVSKTTLQFTGNSLRHITRSMYDTSYS